MFVAQKKIQDFFLEVNGTFTEQVLAVYGISKEKEPELYERLKEILIRDKRKFYRGISFTTADTDREIEKTIDADRTKALEEAESAAK